ncbi:MAG: polyphosphate kinase 2, partial [Polyangiaceae bacterium]
ISYSEVPHQEVTLPERVFKSDYERKPIPHELYVPKLY